MIRGGALATAGALDEGLAEIVAGLEVHGEMDAMSYQTFMISVLGGGLLAAGRYDQAIRVLDDAIAAGEQRKERFYLAELLRLKGEALAATGRLLDAEHWLREAIATAQQQAARLFELRSAVSLCKLRRGDEQRIALQGVLAPFVAGSSLTPSRAILLKRGSCSSCMKRRRGAEASLTPRSDVRSCRGAARLPG